MDNLNPVDDTRPVDTPPHMDTDEEDDIQHLEEPDQEGSLNLEVGQGDANPQPLDLGRLGELIQRQYEMRKNLAQKEDRLIEKYLELAQRN